MYTVEGIQGKKMRAQVNVNRLTAFLANRQIFDLPIILLMFFTHTHNMNPHNNVVVIYAVQLVTIYVRTKFLDM